MQFWRVGIRVLCTCRLVIPANRSVAVAVGWMGAGPGPVTDKKHIESKERTGRTNREEVGVPTRRPGSDVRVSSAKTVQVAALRKLDIGC